MSAPLMTDDVERYVGSVREALVDLDEGDRDDLLEDLRGHLDELRRVEPDVDLVTRLGAPRAYAEELRLAAGLAPSPRPEETLTARLRASRDAVLAGVRTAPGAASVAGFLPQLRPAWWVVRVFGVVAVADQLFARSTTYPVGSYLVPVIHDQIAGAFVLAGLVVLSVRLGQRRERFAGNRRLALIAGNVVLALATLSFVHQLADHDRLYQSVGVVDSGPCCGQLVGENGTVISNIYAYDAGGKRIPEVQLFDQDGQPIDVTTNAVTVQGPLHNVFPQQAVQEVGSNADGSPVTEPVPAPTIDVPRLAVSPTPSPSPVRTSSPRPTPHPSGS